MRPTEAHGEAVFAGLRPRLPVQSVAGNDRRESFAARYLNVLRSKAAHTSYLTVRNRTYPVRLWLIPEVFLIYGPVGTVLRQWQRPAAPASGASVTVFASSTAGPTRHRTARASTS